MMPVRTVFFDIDNTLYDFTACNHKALEALCEYVREQFGWEKEAFLASYKKVQNDFVEEMHSNGSCRNRIFRIQRLLETANIPLSPHVIVMYNIYWDTLLSEITPFEGAELIMRELKEKGIRIGVGTDMTAYMQFRKLEKMGLLPYIDFLVSSEEAGIEKPAAAFFSKCLEKAGCLPGECLFVGDSLTKDIEGALSAGMQARWFNPAGDENRTHPELIRSLPEILSVIQE